jgi:cobaltochelatase CobN
MHRLSTQPGGWNPDTEGVIFVEQRPAPLVIITAADTDIQVLAQALPLLPADFPEIRVVNILQLQQNLTIDTYAETVLSQARGIVLRILGGRAYWSYGLEVVKQIAQETQAALFVIPGDDRPDPDLSSHATVSLMASDRLWRSFNEGGVTNIVHALQFLADVALGTSYQPPMPESIPKVGLYEWRSPAQIEAFQRLTIIRAQFPPEILQLHRVGLLFYRAHYLAGNTAPIDALCQALSDRGFIPVPIFVSSLRDDLVQAELLDLFRPKEGEPVRVLLNAVFPSRD